MGQALVDWHKQRRSYFSPDGGSPVHIADLPDRHDLAAYCGAAMGAECHLNGLLMCVRCCIVALRRETDIMEQELAAGLS